MTEHELLIGARATMAQCGMIKFMRYDGGGGVCALGAFDVSLRERRNGWNGGQYADNLPGVREAYVALARAMRDLDDQRELNHGSAVTPHVTDQGRYDPSNRRDAAAFVAGWNNSKVTTQDEVLAAFDLAITRTAPEAPELTHDDVVRTASELALA